MNFGQFIFEKQNYGRAQNRAFRRRPTSFAAFTPHRHASMKQASLSSRDFAKTLWARMLASFGRSAWTDQACRSSCSRSRLKTLWPHWCDADSALNQKKNKKKQTDSQLTAAASGHNEMAYNSPTSACANCDWWKGGKQAGSPARRRVWFGQQAATGWKRVQALLPRCLFFLVFSKSNFQDIWSPVQNLQIKAQLCRPQMY